MTHPERCATVCAKGRGDGGLGARSAELPRRLLPRHGICTITQGQRRTHMIRSSVGAAAAVICLACSSGGLGVSGGAAGSPGSPAESPDQGGAAGAGPAQPAETGGGAGAPEQTGGTTPGADATGGVQIAPVPLEPVELGYEPLDATWLDLIQSSALGLDAEELAVLSSQGFLITDRVEFPDFTYGYKTIYFEDLPVYVSADSILYALHRSYDALLKDVEMSALIPMLGDLLAGLRAQLGTAGLDAQTEQDLALFLGVAHGLLEPSGATGIDAEMQAFINLATAADGMSAQQIFGLAREIDFSQFQPRGHYTEWEFEEYFRAMIWLGRIDLRLVEVLPDETRVLRRRQLQAALALNELMTAEQAASWEAIDATLTGFVGEADSMTLTEIAHLRSALGIASLDDLAGLTDEQIIAVIDAGGYGVQRINSHLVVADPGTENRPLSNSFAFLGQRYIVDSEVFSNVVFPRVSGTPPRMMPNPLDVAYAALGNDQARALLQPELETYSYAEQLGSTRELVDSHDQDFWDASLYTLWLGALRELSPGPEIADPSAAGLPAVAGTEAWGRRLLNTQLASWAELRHDTLLYAKQSYTMIPTCEYPDAYVDPYPEVFAQLARFASRGSEILSALSSLQASLTRPLSYLSELQTVATTLQGMAEHQRTGVPHSQEQIDFINDAVRMESVDVVCAAVDMPTGWYPRLFYNRDDATSHDPTIADVHTQPADEFGSIVGRVLHVGTGNPRMMVVTVDSCEGPRAYAGVVSSYFEHITTDFNRLTDQRWSSLLYSSPPADVAWMQELVVR